MFGDSNLRKDPGLSIPILADSFAGGYGGKGFMSSILVRRLKQTLGIGKEHRGALDGVDFYDWIPGSEIWVVLAD